jgi:hypothetical protein
VRGICIAVVGGDGPPAGLPPGIEWAPIGPGDDAAAWTSRLSADLVAFTRPGDRFLDGKLDQQAALLDGGGTSFVCTAAVRVDADGRIVERIAAPPEEALEPDLLLLRCPVELSTVVARTDLVVAAAPDAVSPARPGGDATLWAALAGRAPAASIGAPLTALAGAPSAAAHDEAAEIERLRTIVGAPVSRRSVVASKLRRRLLELLALDASVLRPTSTIGLDLFDLRDATPEELTGVVDDVLWALARAADRLAATAVPWASGTVPDDHVLAAGDPIADATPLHAMLTYVTGEADKRLQLLIECTEAAEERLRLLEEANRVVAEQRELIERLQQAGAT